MSMENETPDDWKRPGTLEIDSCVKCGALLMNIFYYDADSKSYICEKCKDLKIKGEIENERK